MQPTYIYNMVNKIRKGPAVGVNDCQSCPTRGHCVAQFLSRESIAALPSVFDTGRSYAKGDYLFKAGDIARSQHYVRSGTVKTFFISRDGTEQVTGFYLPGDRIPQAVENNRHLQSAVALDKTTACASNSDELDACDGLAAALLKHSELMLNAVLNHQLNLSQGSAMSRFAGFCMQMSTRLEALGRAPDYIPTPMSRTDIANYLGLTLESLSRVISKLKKSGVIEASRKVIELQKPEQLSALCLHQA